MEGYGPEFSGGKRQGRDCEAGIAEIEQLFGQVVRVLFYMQLLPWAPVGCSVCRRMGATPEDQLVCSQPAP
jgi:hypothetical protein